MLQWYAAHAIMYVKFKDNNQNKYPIMENVVLISAESDDEALEKAEKRAKEDEGDSLNSFTYEGRSATWVYAGLRKLITCVFPEERPDNGTELTYSEMEVTDKESFEKYVNGEVVTMVYYDA
ncbi:MAG: hypothetical protein B6242_15190 [Anaerolineaceae bacterium 4572_78]|nr:MAG: hypothetical protein B6242_15190 [Anaerolineaceae bacterium 4572_78]